MIIALLLYVLLDVAADIPVNAKIDMTFPIWGVLGAFVAGIAAIIKINTSLLLLKKDFTSLKNELEKRDQNIMRESKELKELMFEFVSPHNKNHNGRHH